jgi:hypothetical protein
MENTHRLLRRLTTKTPKLKNKKESSTIEKFISLEIIIRYKTPKSANTIESQSTHKIYFTLASRFIAGEISQKPRMLPHPITSPNNLSSSYEIEFNVAVHNNKIRAIKLFIKIDTELPNQFIHLHRRRLRHAKEENPIQA